MMRTRTFHRLFLLALGAAALAPFSACSGGGGGGGDDDDGTIEPTHCQVLWSSLGQSAPDRYDVYVVDMPIDLWVSGEQTYTLDVSNEVVAIFYDEYDFDERVYAGRAITTAGTFTTTVGGTSAGNPVTLSDPGSQEFFDINGNAEVGLLVGSGGVASFDGNWSNPDPEESPDPGTGTVTLTYLGDNLTIGTGFVNYAVCYEDDSFAPMTPAQRIGRQVSLRLRAE